MKHQWMSQTHSPRSCCESCGVELNSNNGDDECSPTDKQFAFPLVVTRTKEEAMAVARFWLAVNKQDYCNN